MQWEPWPDRFLDISFSKQDCPHKRQRQTPLRDERVVEVVECAPFLGAVVVAELLDLQLAEGVVEIGGVIGSPPRFLVGVGRLLKALVDEQLGPLLDGPVFGVQLDADDIAAIAEQGLLELSQADLEVASTEALV